MSSEPSATLQPGVSIRPMVSLNLAKQLVKIYFGLDVDKVKELNSYDDKNFYVEVVGTSPVKKFILKVLNSMDSQKPGHIEAQHRTMFYLENKGVQCPVPYKTVEGVTFKVVPIPTEDVENANIATGTDGENENGSMHLVRLLSFVEGTILYDVPINTKLLYKVGAYIAHIEKLLKECNNFPELKNHSTIWMLACFMKLSGFVYAIEDQPDKFDMVKSVLTAFKENIEPLIPSLEGGPVHGDYNEQNILVQPSSSGGEIVDYDISGLIDFGDMNIGPYVFELAITVCYMMLESIRCGLVEPFESVGHVIAGYASIRKIPEIELELLRTLVACRLCQSLVMAAYTRTIDPGNDYILTTSGRGWNLLNRVWNETSDEQMVGLCKSYLN